MCPCHPRAVLPFRLSTSGEAQGLPLLGKGAEVRCSVKFIVLSSLPVSDYDSQKA